MTTFASVRPRVPDRILSLIIDHNPFYLLSAAFMLLGVFMINNAQDMKPGDLTKLLLLLGVLNLYEFLVIFLGRLLVWKTTVPRDGMTLLILEALFFADITFLNAETVMTSLVLGTLLNIALLLLAVFKSGLILHTMRIKISPALMGFLALQLSALFMLPVVLKLHARDDHVIELWLYAAWWVAGILPLAFDLLSRLFPRQMANENAPAKSQALRLVYVILPFFSLVSHIGFLHWVYKSDFYAAELAPIFLGLAISLVRLPRPDLTLFWRLALPVTALIVSLGNPSPLHITLFSGFPELTPLRAAMAGTYLTLAYVFFFNSILYFLAGGIMMMLIVAFGPSVSTILKVLGECANLVEMVVAKCLALFRRAMPTTAASWGILSIVGSFAFLAIGAIVSFLSHHRPRPAEPMPDTPPQE